MFWDFEKLIFAITFGISASRTEHIESNCDLESDLSLGSLYFVEILRIYKVRNEFLRNDQMVNP